MPDLIKVTEDGLITGNYWDNLREFETRASNAYGLRKDLIRRVEFEQNQHKQRQNEQRKEVPDDQVK